MGDCDIVNLGTMPDVLDALQCGAVVVDRAGIVVCMNRRLADLTGIERNEIIGHPMTAFWRDEVDRREAKERLSRNFDHTVEGEITIPLPGGGHLPVLCAARPAGRTPPWSELRIVTIMDLSAIRQAQDELKAQYDAVAGLSNTILEQALDLKHYSDKLEDRVRERTEELRIANMDAIYMLAEASEARDEDTGRHVRRIETLSRSIARRFGIAEAEAEQIGYSSILHDIGKLQVPDDILKKPGKLTAEERAAMEQHTLIGEKILSERTFFDAARRIARSHHENWDGSGYPDRLGGQAIPIEARIVHLADVYDALSHPRIYKPAWTPGDALGAIKESAGRMFDPEIVKVFGEVWSAELARPDVTTTSGESESA